MLAYDSQQMRKIIEAEGDILCSSGVIVPSNPSNRPASAATVRSMSHASTVLLDDADLLSTENTPRKLPMNLNAIVGELAEWQLL